MYLKDSMILVPPLNFEGMPHMFDKANPDNACQDSYKTSIAKRGSRCDLQAIAGSRSFFADSEDGILIRGEVCDDSEIFIIVY